MNDPQTPQPSQNEEEIFVIQPTPAKPPSKRSVWTTVLITLSGVLFLFIVLLATLYASASTIAHNYSSLSLAQLKKLEVPLKQLEPSLVLNKRNIDPPINKIYISKQSQPSLENVLFVGGINSRYQKAQSMEGKVKEHYETLDQYTEDVGNLLLFQDFMNEMKLQQAAFEANLQPADPLRLYSASGSFKALAEKLQKQNAPSELESTKKLILTNYKKQAKVYEAWAKEVEAGNSANAAVNQQQIQNLKALSLASLTEKSLASKFKDPYAEIIKTQKSLEQALLSL